MRRALAVAVCLVVSLMLAHAQRQSTRLGESRVARAAPSSTAPRPGVVAATGQMHCWDDDGNRVSCVGTGQDGDHRKGYSLRFTDNGDGTVTDHLTKLIWLKDAGCSAFFAGDSAGDNSRNWTDALTAANRLAKRYCGLSDGSMPGDWRLPNIRELESLLDYGQSGPALATGHPFTGFERPTGSLAEYWTSTTTAGLEHAAWKIDGQENLPRLKSTQIGVWPVRGGYAGRRLAGADSRPWPGVVAKTGQTECWDQVGNPVDCQGTGQDGEYQMGYAVKRRFTDNGDGTVTDHLTNLIWLKNADCHGADPWGRALSHVNGLAEGDFHCDLSDGSAPGDWRMPSIRELQSLNDFGQHDPALPPGHPFHAVRLDWYWSSTTHVDRENRAWQVDLDRGAADTDRKEGDDDEELYVWPVRSGY